MTNFICNLKSKKLKTVLILVTLSMFLSSCKKDSSNLITGGFNEKQGLVIAGNVDDDNLDISAKVSGTVEKIYKDKGDFVKKGELIFKLDDETVKAKIAQLQAQANQALAAMNTQGSVSDSQVEQATGAYNAALGQVEQATGAYNAALAQVGQAKGAYNAANAQFRKAKDGARNQEIQQLQAQYNLYKATFKRISALFKDGSVTKQKYDEAYTQMKASQEQLSMAKEGARKEDIRTAEAQVEQAKGAVNAATAQVGQAKGAVNAATAQVGQAKGAIDVAKSGKLQISVYQAQYKQAMAGIQEANISLKDTKIYSPCNGTIMETTVKEGELAVAGMNIASINNLEKSELNLKVYETDLQNVTLNKKVRVRLLSTGDKEFNGIVKTVLSKPSFATKRASHNDESDVLAYEVKVEARFPKDVRIYPGMTAYVQFPNKQQ